MLRLQRSVLIVLIFIISACSQTPSLPIEATPTFTPWVEGTEMALASPTPWFAGTETALASNAILTVEALNTATPTTLPTLPPATATPTALPTLPPATVPTMVFSLLPEGTFSPVLYGSKDSSSFLIVGGIKKDQGWLAGDQAAQFIGTPMNYDFFSSNRFMQIQGSVLELEQPCGNYVIRSPVILPESMVGVASGWIPQKRVTRDLAIDDPVYIQAVAEWFQSQGNSPREIRITRILRVDLEGDGVAEVLLSASYFTEKMSLLTETGDYSVVLMRKLIGDEVVTIPLVKDYYVSSVPELEVSYPNTYTLVDALDLNGDGTLEVVVDIRRWEGWGAIVYRVDGQNVREVMKSIC